MVKEMELGESLDQERECSLLFRPIGEVPSPRSFIGTMYMPPGRLWLSIRSICISLPMTRKSWGSMDPLGWCLRYLWRVSSAARASSCEGGKDGDALVGGEVVLPMVGDILVDRAVVDGGYIEKGEVV